MLWFSCFCFAHDKSEVSLASLGKDVENDKVWPQLPVQALFNHLLCFAVVYLSFDPVSVRPLRTLQQWILSLQLRQLPAQAIHLVLELFVVFDDVNHFIEGLVQTL